MARKDYLNLMAVARIYLFTQLFATPLLLGIFDQTALASAIERALYFPLATSFSERSVAISVLAYVCFICGGGVHLPRLTMGLRELDWRSPRILRMFWIAFLAGFVFKLMRVAIGDDIQVSSARIGLLGETATFFMSLNWFHMLALPFLAIAYYENSGLNKRIASYYPVVLLCYLANGAFNGSTSFLMFPLAIHLAIRQRYRPIGCRGLISVALLLLAVVYLKIFMKIVIVDDSANQLDVYAPLTFLTNRISLSFVVSAIVDNSTFSYGYGVVEQFLYCLNIPGYEYAIPDGNLLGRFYAIIPENDSLTGIAISSVGDMVLHWGIGGAALGMFITGVMYRWISDFTTVDSKLPWVVYAMLWPIMIHGLESPVSVLWSTALKVSVLCILYYLIGLIFLVSPSRHVMPNPDKIILRQSTSA